MQLNEIFGLSARERAEKRRKLALRRVQDKKRIAKNAERPPERNGRKLPDDDLFYEGIFNKDDGGAAAKAAYHEKLKARDRKKIRQQRGGDITDRSVSRPEKGRDGEKRDVSDWRNSSSNKVRNGPV